MKKGKEFIFPENVEKDYGIWKDYTLKDFGYVGLALVVGLVFIAIPPFGLILISGKIIIVVIAMTIVMAILTIKPIASRRNIKVRDYLKMKQRYSHSQKIYFLKPQKREKMYEENED